MAKVTVGIPQGTRDFGPDTVRKRNFILDTIRGIFELYGFQPLETPAMENLETLMGKYGEEGDKLIFRILNNGLDHPGKTEQAQADFEKLLQGKNVKGITERALKYDLTIPFARYVAMNHAKLTFPFKRYQVQPVWRADRPQKGRYREFYQCDADVVGSPSLLNEIELANIYQDVFTRLGMTDYELRINHRAILTALGEGGDAPMISMITTAIDKLDKIGLEKVMEELQSKGLATDQLSRIKGYMGIAGTNEEKLIGLRMLLGEHPSVEKGIRELTYMIESGPALTIDFTLARGLNYYTGIIFEAKAPARVTMGSIGGGGRYDDLTGLFGLPNIPGVGISFGVDRIYDVMEELKLFPATVGAGAKFLFLNMGEKESQVAFGWMQELRKRGVSCELYPDPGKIDKQFKYAEAKQIRFVVTIGETELKTGTCKIKNIETGEQQNRPCSDLFHFPL